MKKKMFLLLFLSFVFMGIVNAEDYFYENEEKACTASELAKLRQDSANVKVSYVPGREEQTVNNGELVSTTNVRYVDVKVFNLTSEMYITVTATGKNIKKTVNIFDYSKKGGDGAITMRQSALSEKVDYEIVVSSAKANCYGDKIRTFKITIPKFNNYSELKACEDIPEFYLCQEYITFNIDGSKFYDAVDAYREKKAKVNDEAILEDATLSSNTAKGLSKYKYIIVGAIVVAGVIATIVIMKRKRSVS